MNTSNKLLMGLLLTVLVFITVLFSTARFYAVEREDRQEVVTPPAAPAVPEAPAPPTTE